MLISNQIRYRRIKHAKQFERTTAADIQSDAYIMLAEESIMQIAKWGNSLAVRLPAAVVEALQLKEGDNIEIHVVGEKVFEVEKKPGGKELLARLRQYRGRLPADFKFDRLEAHENR